MTEKYLIVGTYQGKSEVVDETETKKDAEYLAREYGMAYGNEWDISIQVQDE